MDRGFVSFALFHPSVRAPDCDMLVLVLLPVLCSQNMLFVEASAKTAAGVSDIFESVAAKLAGGLPVSVAARAVQ
jgi:hypothetical protein